MPSARASSHYKFSCISVKQTCGVVLHMPGVHASSFSQAVNVHGVVAQKLVGACQLRQGPVTQGRLSFASLCIDVSKKRLQQQHHSEVTKTLLLVTMAIVTKSHSRNHSHDIQSHISTGL